MASITQQYVPDVPTEGALSDYYKLLKNNTYNGDNPNALGRYGDTGKIVNAGPRAYAAEQIAAMAPQIKAARAAANAAQDPRIAEEGARNPMGAYGALGQLGMSGGSGIIPADIQFANSHPYGAQVSDYIGANMDQTGNTVPGAKKQSDLWTGGWENVTTPAEALAQEKTIRAQELAAARDSGGFFGAITNMLPALATSFIPGAGLVMAAKSLAGGNYLGAALGALGGVNSLNGMQGAAGGGGFAGMKPGVAGATGNLGFDIGSLSPGHIIGDTLGVSDHVGNAAFNAGVGGVHGGVAGAAGSLLGDYLKGMGSVTGNSTVDSIGKGVVSGAGKGLLNDWLNTSTPSAPRAPTVVPGGSQQPTNLLAQYLAKQKAA